MPDPLSTNPNNEDALAAPVAGPVRMAMALPPEVPPSGGMPPGKTRPGQFLFPMREPASETGGAGPRPAGKQEVLKPPSPAVAKAMRRIALYMKEGWGTGGDPSQGPSPVLQQNLAILQRGGPMAEAMAQHMLKTFREHPQELPGLQGPVIEHE